jgi:hypothetical protein
MRALCVRRLHLQVCVRERVQPPQRARLVALHSTLTQVLRTISLFHRVRGVVRSSQVSVYVRSHHVSLG